MARQHLVDNAALLPDARSHGAERVVRQRLRGHRRNHRRLSRITPRCQAVVAPAAVHAQLPQLREHLAMFGDRVPAELRTQLEAREELLGSGYARLASA